jgi:hypothetical protein
LNTNLVVLGVFDNVAIEREHSVLIVIGSKCELPQDRRHHAVMNQQWNPIVVAARVHQSGHVSCGQQ